MRLEFVQQDLPLHVTQSSSHGHLGVQWKAFCLRLLRSVFKSALLLSSPALTPKGVLAGALAALALALIPYFTGQIVDFATIDQDKHAFTLTTGKLLAASLACAVFTGIRGGLFTVGITRLNVRLRTNLFASLLRQDMGYFDTAKSGQLPLAVRHSTLSKTINIFLQPACFHLAAWRSLASLRLDVLPSIHQRVQV